MGIKLGTCVMNFDGATGYLIGPENQGLECMFTFMNTARIGTAIQGGVGPPAELSYQWLWITPGSAVPCGRCPARKSRMRLQTA